MTQQYQEPEQTVLFQTPTGRVIFSPSKQSETTIEVRGAQVSINGITLEDPFCQSVSCLPESAEPESQTAADN